MYLFDVASRHMRWLADRQAVTAQNIANADTAGYRSRDVAPFASLLDGTPLALNVTSPGHMSAAEASAGSSGRQPGESWGSAHSGNNISIEQELMTANSSARMMNLDSALARSFHRMLLASVKV